MEFSTCRQVGFVVRGRRKRGPYMNGTGRRKRDGRRKRGPYNGTGAVNVARTH